LLPNGCLASAARQAVSSKPGSGGQATNPEGAVHKLVLWAGGLSTAGACSKAVVKSTLNSFDGSIFMSNGGSVSVSAKASIFARAHIAHQDVGDATRELAVVSQRGIGWHSHFAGTVAQARPLDA